MRRIIIILLSVLCLMPAGAAKKTTNSIEARRVFDKVYDMVFGPQGCSLHYDVNIISIYKTNGTISYKGKKQRFSDERVDTWNDGVTAYMVYRKKKTIEIHDSSSDKKDKYSGKFKFDVNDFDYSMKNEDGHILLTLKQHKGAKGTIKEAKVTLDPKTLYPTHVKVKVAFIWANISISNFRPGGIQDNIFVFPRNRYGSEYKYVDKRGM